MNKKAKELLDNCIKLKITDKFPLFKGIYIIQQRKLHDSGYRQMYVIGWVYDNEKQEEKDYLIGTYSDVVDIGPPFREFLGRDYRNMCDIHLDISSYGIIRIWTNDKTKRFKIDCPYVSSCMLEVVNVMEEK